VFAVDCFVKRIVVNMLHAFGRGLETAPEGKCQQAISSGVGESVARNRHCTRRNLGEEGQL
jgi:hypothetical protein